MTLSLHAGSPLLRCTLELDNQARDHRLRARVRTGLPGVSATAGAQFGIVARPSVSLRAGRYRRETPVATAPAHRFVACSSRNRGLALLTPGFFEYELQGNGDLLMTLLRSVGQLSRGDLPTRPGHAGWPVAHAGGAVPRRGAATARARAGHPGRPGGGNQLAAALGGRLPPGPRASGCVRHPRLARLRSKSGSRARDWCFPRIKPAEQGAGLVLRCYNARPQPAAGVWHIRRPGLHRPTGRADERQLHEIRLGEGGRIRSLSRGAA